jgi:uroporphyrinogen decarboxylase
MSLTHIPNSILAEHTRIAQSVVKEARDNDGLAPVDLDRFWADQAIAKEDPFGASIPQCPLGITMWGECVYDELGIPEDYWRYETDLDWQISLNKAYNDLSEKIVGRRLLNEVKPDPSRAWPTTKALHDVFESKNVWLDRSWWLMEVAHDERELEKLLNRVDKRLENLREFVLPANWETEKQRLRSLGVPPPLYRWQRGPVTFATSIFGIENLIFLINDNPDLAGRFRDAIIRAMLEIGRILDEEAGFTQSTSPRGFGFADDNCAMLTPEMYEFFGFPVLKKIWEVYSPGEKDRRYQHSDSAMAHHLPVLGKLKLTGTNFGPTVTVAEIRKHLPRAVIDGQLAPFTFCRNEEEKIVIEFLRDFEQARATRGLNFATAGSINNGSRLTGLRLIMSAIQRYGRY